MTPPQTPPRPITIHPRRRTRSHIPIPTFLPFSRPRMRNGRRRGYGWYRHGHNRRMMMMIPTPILPISRIVVIDDVVITSRSGNIPIPNPILPIVPLPLSMSSIPFAIISTPAIPPSLPLMFTFILPGISLPLSVPLAIPALENLPRTPLNINRRPTLPSPMPTRTSLKRRPLRTRRLKRPRSSRVPESLILLLLLLWLLLLLLLLLSWRSLLRRTPSPFPTPTSKTSTTKTCTNTSKTRSQPRTSPKHTPLLRNRRKPINTTRRRPTHKRESLTPSQLSILRGAVSLSRSRAEDIRTRPSSRRGLMMMVMMLLRLLLRLRLLLGWMRRVLTNPRRSSRNHKRTQHPTCRLPQKRMQKPLITLPTARSTTRTRNRSTRTRSSGRCRRRQRQRRRRRRTRRNRKRSLSSRSSQMMTPRKRIRTCRRRHRWWDHVSVLRRRWGRKGVDRTVIMRH